jgi:hypothetical protein
MPELPGVLNGVRDVCDYAELLSGADLHEGESKFAYGLGHL